MTKIEKTIAHIFSIILHPFFMATYGVCLLFVYTDFKFLFAGQFIRFLAPVFILSFLIPANIIFLMKKAKLISDYDLKNKNERYLPFLAIFVCYGLMFFFFYNAHIFIWFLALLISPLILLIIASAINLFWKISAHMMGIGGLIGGVMSVSYYVKAINPYILFIILFILAGCLGVSRLILDRHTPAQVYAGFIIGFAITFISVCVSILFV